MSSQWPACDRSRFVSWLAIGDGDRLLSCQELPFDYGDWIDDNVAGATSEKVDSWIGSQIKINVPIWPAWNSVTSRTHPIIITVVTRCAVIRYVHSRISGIAVLPSCTNDQGAYGAFFIFYLEEDSHEHDSRNTLHRWQGSRTNSRSGNSIPELSSLRLERRRRLSRRCGRKIHSFKKPGVARSSARCGPFPIRRDALAA